MKKILVSVAVLMATVATAQVGIHTKKPQATLDVKAKTEDGSKAEGILVPRLTGDAALKMLETLTEAEHSMLIFVTDPPSTEDNPILGVAGYYRYEYHTDEAGTETKTWVPLEPSGLHRVKTSHYIDLRYGDEPPFLIKREGEAYKLIGSSPAELGVDAINLGLFGEARGDESAVFLSGEALGYRSLAMAGGIASNFGEIAIGENFSTDSNPHKNGVSLSYGGEKHQLFSIGTTGSFRTGVKRFNAMVILRDGSTGIAIPADRDNPANSKPTEKLDVNGTARFRTINENAGNVATDKVVVADSKGVLKTIDRSALASTSTPYTAGAGITITDKNEISRTGLEEVTKEGKTGWRLIGVIDEDHPDSYRSSIGNGALDLVSAEKIEESPCYSRPPLDSSDRYETHLTSGATGDFSVALGVGSFAKGEYSTALGLGNASGLGSVAIGTYTDYCFFDELKADARGEGAVAIGATSVAMNKAEVAFGSNFSTDYTFPEGASDPIPITQVGKNKEQLFSIGTIEDFSYYGISSSKFNGDSYNNNYNAMVILRDGSTGIAIPADRDNPANSKPTEKLDVNGTARLRTINENAGNVATDKVVVADSKGVLKTIDRSALASTSTPYTAGAGITIDKNEISRTGLEEVTKDGKTGWRLIGQGLDSSNDPVDIGDNALDLSVQINTGQCTSRPNLERFFGAKGDASVALGAGAFAEGGNSFALGSLAYAGGEHSMALGSANASGESSIAIGNMNRCQPRVNADGKGSVAIGSGSIAMNTSEIALGYNFSTDYTFSIGGESTKISGIDDDKKQLFSIGNYIDNFLSSGGTVYYNRFRSNAMVILRDGSTGIAIPSDIQNPEKSKPTEKLDVNGTARLRTINENAGNVATDKIVVADSKGVLKTIDRSTLGGGNSSTSNAYTAGSGIILEGNTISRTGLEKITETPSSEEESGDNRTGWRLVGVNSSLYGTIGNDAVDLSTVWDSPSAKLNEDYWNSHQVDGKNLQTRLHFTGATGEGSLAAGQNTTASGEDATAMGYGTIAAGDNSFAVGDRSRSFADNSIAMGKTVEVNAFNSIGAGNWLEVNSIDAAVFGVWNHPIAKFDTRKFTAQPVLYNNGEYKDFYQPTDEIFAVGNGKFSNHRSNAIVVLRNGKTGINLGQDSPKEALDVNGTARLRGIKNSNSETDKVVVIDGDGVLKTIERSWFEKSSHNARKSSHNFKQANNFDAKDKIEELSSHLKEQEKKLQEKDTKIKELEAKLQSQDERLKRLEDLLK